MQQSFLLRKVFYLFHPLNKSCESRPVWGACQFPALWHFAEGLFIFCQLFEGKRKIFMINDVYIILSVSNYSNYVKPEKLSFV